MRTAYRVEAREHCGRLQIAEEFDEARPALDYAALLVDSGDFAEVVVARVEEILHFRAPDAGP